MEDEAGAPIPGFEHEYELLRRLAGELMRRERPGHELQPTALVHETYVRLAGAGEACEDRAHFLALAARVMRRVLVDAARKRRALRRGGGAMTVSLERAWVGAPGDGGPGLIEVDEVLALLMRAHPRAGRVAELKLFSGLTGEEIASLLGVSARTVDLDWRLARAWLADRLEGSA